MALYVDKHTDNFTFKLYVNTLLSCLFYTRNLQRRAWKPSIDIISNALVSQNNV